jgi:hypothetical protein
VAWSTVRQHRPPRHRARRNFVIDSKNWSGAITVKDGVLRQNGYRREPAVAGCADSALAVGELLPRYVDRVSPVLCFVRDEPVEGWARDVMLCSTTNLVAMLNSRPTVFGINEMADAVITLRARMHSMADPAPRRRHGTSTCPSAALKAQSVSASPTAVPQTGRRQVKRSLKRLVTGVGVWWLATMALYLTVGPLTKGSDNVLAPATIVLAILSWLLMRRLIK